MKRKEFVEQFVLLMQSGAAKLTRDERAIERGEEVALALLKSEYLEVAGPEEALRELLKFNRASGSE